MQTSVLISLGKGIRFYLSNKKKIKRVSLYLQNYGSNQKRYAFTIWNQIHRKDYKGIYHI
jgi:hypothetical protein